MIRLSFKNMVCFQKIHFLCKSLCPVWISLIKIIMVITINRCNGNYFFSLSSVNYSKKAIKHHGKVPVVVQTNIKHVQQKIE